MCWQADLPVARGRFEPILDYSSNLALVSRVPARVELRVDGRGGKLLHRHQAAARAAHARMSVHPTLGAFKSTLACLPVRHLEPQGKLEALLPDSFAPPPRRGVLAKRRVLEAQVRRQERSGGPTRRRGSGYSKRRSPAAETRCGQQGYY